MSIQNIYSVNILIFNKYSQNYVIVGKYNIILYNYGCIDVVSLLYLLTWMAKQIHTLFSLIIKPHFPIIEIFFTT